MQMRAFLKNFAIIIDCVRSKSLRCRLSKRGSMPEKRQAAKIRSAVEALSALVKPEIKIDDKN